MEDLLSRWQAVAEAAGLPNGLGIPGWRERAELLSEAQAAAESLSDLEREKAAKAQMAADWDAAVSSLAIRPRSTRRIRAACGLVRRDQGLPMSSPNRTKRPPRCTAKRRRCKRVAQLRDERTELEQSLDQVAAAHDVDRSGLDDLVARTQMYEEAVAALESPEAQLRATHPGTTLGELEPARS